MPTAGKPVKGGAQVVTEEELIRQQETKRRHEVLLAARLQELLDEEESMARTSMKDIESRWMEWLRSQKHKELIAEIDIVQNTFEKTLDRKNAVIAMLSKDLDEAEEQHRLAMRTHLQSIDALIDVQNRRMADLDDQFERNLVELKSDFEAERDELQLKHQLEMADLRLVIKNIRAEGEREDRKLQEETSESHDTAIEKMDEERKQMQTELTKYTEGLKSQMNAHYLEFNNTAEVNLKEYTDLTATDEKQAKDIEGQMRKIQKLQESISTWKSNLSNNIRECEERNEAMRAEKETIARHYKELKLKMHIWRLSQEKRLAEVVTSARKTRVALESTSERVERILRSAELCRELETEREKILAFESDITVAEVEADVAQRVKKQVHEEALTAGRADTDLVTVDQMLALGDEAAATSTEDWRLLERFWAKFNKVLLDNAAIAQEKFHLENENTKLRALLKQYLDGISVSHEVMSHRNTLLQTGKVKSAPSLEATRGTAAGGPVVVDGKKVVLELVKQRAS